MGAWRWKQEMYGGEKTTVRWADEIEKLGVGRGALRSKN